MIVERFRGSPVVPGTVAGVVAGILVAPQLVRLRPLFRVPGNGIGLVTQLQYPKGWDYAVVAALFSVAAAVSFGVAIAVRARADGSAQSTDPASGGGQGSVMERHPWVVLFLMVAVAALTIPARDDPYEFIDPYHHGENLSPASEMLRGARPYRDIFFMHGIATDGGLDLLVMGSPPQPVRALRFRAFLSCLTLALLVPIAAEVSVTLGGMIGGVAASLAALAAGELTTFPFFRLAPLLLTVWLVLRSLRTRRSRDLAMASCIAGAGLLWSVDIGVFAVGGLWGWLILSRRVPVKRMAVLAALTAGTPLLLLLMLRADVGRFLRDTFIRFPECFDAIYSVPAPAFPTRLSEWIVGPAARYYVPVIAYGVMFTAAFLVRASFKAEALLLFSVTELLHFRVAAGRTGWAHDRFAVPLLGIALAAFVVEPLLRRRRIVPALVAMAFAVLAYFHFEVPDNGRYLWKYYSTYRARLSPAPDRVRYRVPRMRSLYTYEKDAEDTRALYLFSQSMPPGPIFDYSGEKILYYLLARPAAARCHDIPYLADPKLGREAIVQLERNRPVFIVVKGLDVVNKIDNIDYRTRTPFLAEWIDRHYPRRTTVGRYTIALPSF
jgi:hypothetical protein